MQREFTGSSRFGEIENRLKALDARIAHHKLFLNKAQKRKKEMQGAPEELEN